VMHHGRLWIAAATVTGLNRRRHRGPWVDGRSVIVHGRRRRSERGRRLYLADGQAHCQEECHHWIAPSVAAERPVNSAWKATRSAGKRRDMGSLGHTGSSWFTAMVALAPRPRQ